jgi:hypothetical protein
VSLVVGTGGQSEYPARREDDRLASAPIKRAGALRVELNPNGASMQFLTTDGVVRDSSVVACNDDNPQQDVAVPTAPVDVSATRSPDGSVSLNWSPALDETGIAAYDIYRDGEIIGSVPPAAAFVDEAAGDEPEYWVVAHDASGNVSPASESVIPDGAGSASALFSDDFGTGALSRWSEVNGLIVEPNDEAAAGWIARARGANKPAFARVEFSTGAAGPEIDLRVMLSFRQLDQGANPAVLFRLRSQSGDSLFGISISEHNGVGLYNDLLGTGLNSSRQITRGDRHVIIAHLTGTIDAVTLTLYLDDEVIDDLTSTFSLGDLSIGGLQLGDSRGDRLFDLQFFDVSIMSGPPPSTELDLMSPSPNKVHPPMGGQQPGAALDGPGSLLDLSGNGLTASTPGEAITHRGFRSWRH